MTATPILSSTLFLTVLSLIGLIFFIRASVKDRTTLLQCFIDGNDSDRLNQLQSYFLERAYQVQEVNPQQQTLRLTGYVRPSLFLAFFLSAMAGLGLGCLALVLATLWPTVGQSFLLLCLLSPLAGWFYWQKAGRWETIKISISIESPVGNQALLNIQAHRDELAQLKQHFAWPWLATEEH